MRRITIIIFAAISFAVMYGGIEHFDHANSWLELFKGLFWLCVGGRSLAHYANKWEERNGR